jgi:hypothetical protein
MASGSARSWIAVHAAQQSTPQQKNENKKHDNSAFKKINQPLEPATP